MRTSVTVALTEVSLVVVATVMMMSEQAEAKGQDYYTLLGVKRGATPAQIKRSYRKMASKMHPDLHPGDKKAEEVWMEITRAYEVLSDARQREIYDQHGEEGVNQSGHQQQQQGATHQFRWSRWLHHQLWRLQRRRRQVRGAEGTRSGDGLADQPARSVSGS
eukprot:EC793827.1.p1 GENE.EC793827.1~~EC793827.1.p1  ORF type:complete len:162 (+),score=29.06 EC793827.1:107-592(+)